RAAIRFVETLPHVKYTGVALVFITERSMSKAVEFVQTRFIRSIPTKTFERITGLGLRISSVVDERDVYVAVDGDENLVTEDAELGLRVHVYHQWPDHYPSHEDALTALRKVDDDYRLFRSFEAELVGSCGFTAA